jgi:uncharacterized coiled-coil DUF342 family protein
MESANLTIEILKGIREEVRETNVRIDGLRDEVRGTNARVDTLRGEVRGTNTRVDDLRDELSRRIVESEIRTSTAITDLAGTVRDLTSVLRAQADLRPRVERCERDIEDLKKRA